MIEVVYLLRQGTDPSPFLESYYQHDAGMEHRLCNYFKLKIDLRKDLDSYRAYAIRSTVDWLVFFNSYTVINADLWLYSMWTKANSENSLLVGCSSSKQSFYSNRPTWWRRFFFPPAPNWHIRTNAFLIERKFMLRIWPRFIYFKQRAYCFESGWRSMTRRAMELGANPVSLDDLSLIKDNRCKTYHNV